MSQSSFNTAPSRWFQISGDIRIAAIDKVNVTDIHPSRILSEWALVLVTGGERTFSVCGENYMVRSNEFFILPPHLPHGGIKPDCHQAYYVHFTADGKEVSPPARIASDRILLPLYGQIPLDLHCTDTMDYTIRHRTPPFYSESFCTSQIVAILYQLSLHMQKNFLWTKQENTTAYAILKFIDDNLDKRLCDQDYSRAFKKSYRQLNNVFSRIYGMTIKQMQMNLRISRAKSMLSSGYSIANTSASCGFEDYLYFLKTFKSKTGFTPSEYIRQFYSGDSAGS